jgi:heme o synthase
LIRNYYLLTKPGIIYSNLLTALGGFFLAERGSFDARVFFALSIGLGCVIASACVFNNYIDQGIDAKMDRTKKRALVQKSVSGRDALIFGTILGITGFSLLLFYTNITAASIALIGFFFYVVIYSISKRKTVWGTVIGSISGAVPPAVGYCAVTNNIDLTALLLFIILMLWQMPHLYAIAIFRKDDYAAAFIPVLPLKKGMLRTKEQIVIYILAYLIAVGSLTAFGYTGYSFLIINLLFGIIWLGMALKGFHVTDNQKWARKLFFYSLVVIVMFSILLALNFLLP